MAPNPCHVPALATGVVVMIGGWDFGLGMFAFVLAGIISVFTIGNWEEVLSIWCFRIQRFSTVT